MGKVVHFIGPWDLNAQLPSIPATPAAGPVLFVESVEKGRSLPFHKKKLVLILSAQRHFAAELREAGFDVHLVRARNYASGIRDFVNAHGGTKVIAMMPRDVGVEQSLRNADLGAPLELLDDGGDGSHFYLQRHEFLDWAKDRKQLRMDQFYRWMRKRTGLLMTDGKPVGGRMSFDKENRKRVRNEVPPILPTFAPDAMTKAVMDEVREAGHGWGEVEGFCWPVTRTDALRALDRFIDERIIHYGDFQDAMVRGEPFLWHACLSPMMNIGLLNPREVVDAVYEAWADKGAPINAVEGFIRQVIGWREFIRGVYHLRMPDLRHANRFGARRALPDFFWEPDRCSMTCVQESVAAVKDHGYAHHIQRLMVLGNYGLLAGVAPLELSHWFWAGFVDAAEWVELPNVHGMALNAESTFTTKPYASSGSYINKMSDYCKSCRFDVKKRHGDDACPFNYLFWNFMDHHRELLSENPRVGVLYRSWDRWTDEERDAIRASASNHLTGLQPLDHGWHFYDDQG